MYRQSLIVLVLACIVLALAAPSMAQRPTPSTDPARVVRADAQQRAQWAGEWLRAEDPRLVAWGAWLARQDRRTELIPFLLERVEQYQPTDSPSTEIDRHDSLLVVLDALIALRASVPAKEARKLYPEFAAQSVILLVRSRDDAQPGLLDIFNSARANWTWLAAGNVLLKNRTPGFAALLLSRFTQHLTISVVDGGMGGGIGGGGSECGFWLAAPKEGWPPVGLYRLSQFPERMPTREAPTFLVGGETTVYYLRIETGNYDNPPDVPGSCDDGNRDYYRAQYLNKLMEFSSFPQITLDPYPYVTIVWKGATDYKQQLLEAVEERRTKFRRAVVWLRESGRVLTFDESKELEPRIEIVIRDDRADRSAPLPAVLQLDGTAEARAAFSKPIY